MQKSKNLKFVFVFVLVTMFFQTLLQAIERRREQFVTDFGYVAIPIPFSVPGVGTGLGVAGNINSTTMSFPWSGGLCPHVSHSTNTA